jgi:hypothetical protein
MKKGKKRGKKAVFFSTDAIISLIIIFLVVLVVYPVVKYSEHKTQINQDIIEVFSSLKIGELDDSYAHQLISEGKIRDLNKSLLEQIGEFYVTNRTIAENLADSSFSYLNTTENIGIWYGNTLIACSNSSPYEYAEDIQVEKQIISGIQQGKNITGFSSRSWLSSSLHHKYFYFGGYVGDGNISVKVDYNGNITDAYLEIAANVNFSLCVNEQCSGHFEPADSELIPKSFDISAYKDWFDNGDNIIKFVPQDAAEKLYIAGGYIKISYQNLSYVKYKRTDKYYFPGIEGLINLYDGFYISGTLKTMNIFLHLETDFISFLTIGNTTIFRNRTYGEEAIQINNSELSSLLNYNGLSNKSIPLRLGMENVSYKLNISLNADVISVTDLSGSMDDNCGGCNEVSCTDTWGSCHDGDGCKICDAKDGNYALINGILNTTKNNKIGLVGYRSSVSDSDCHSLSDDTSSLISEVSSWDADGGTCICCGINSAVDKFLETLSFEDLVGFYDFEGDVLDNSGNGNDCSSHGTSYVTGIINQGLDFDGNDWLDISNTDDINLGTHEKRSISVWFNVSNKDLSNKQVIYEEGGGSRGINIYIYQGSLYVGGWNEPSGESNWQGTWLNTDTINNDTWHHVVLVLNGTSSLQAGALKAYLDGSEFDSGQGSQLWEHSGDIQIGRNGDTKFHDGDDSSDGEYLIGVLDHFKIYNKALSLSEIQGLAETNPTCGNNITEFDEVCDGNNRTCGGSGFIGIQECNPTCSGWQSCQKDDRYRAMVVMSDGHATYECSEQGWTPDLNGDGLSDRPEDDAIQAACDAYNNYGIFIHSVGFGAGADENTLQLIANCGNGTYSYGDVDTIVDVYKNISENILKATFYEQTIEASENIKTTLFPDSYIEFNYTSSDIPYGLIISAEEENFDAISLGTVNIPVNSTLVEAFAISYSGPKWTRLVKANNTVVYNLSNYGSNYLFLGDPYAVSIPVYVMGEGDNPVQISSAASPSDAGAGSTSNKVIYKIIKPFISYSDIYSSAEGCRWNVTFEDDSEIIIDIPYNYSGSNTCNYKQEDYNENDAIQVSVYNLLKELDFDGNDKLDVEFTEQDLRISSNKFIGIPYSWDTEVQVRVWN